MGSVQESHMDFRMDKVSSREVSDRFDYFYDKATVQPIAIERNGVALVVMLPAAEYERLARLDHIALAPDELSNEAVRAIETAEPGNDSQAANGLMDYQRLESCDREVLTIEDFTEDDRAAIAASRMPGSTD
jgi:hypothetical protein